MGEFDFYFFRTGRLMTVPCHAGSWLFSGFDGIQPHERETKLGKGMEDDGIGIEVVFNKKNKRDD